MTVKGYDIFETQFGELVADLRKSLAPSAPASSLSPAEATT